MPSPDDLREAFRELRAAEQRNVPPFRLTGAPEPRQRRLGLALAIAALLIVVVAAALLRRASIPQRPAISSISTWKAPTDFLLQTPNAKLLRTVPTFGIPKRGTSS